MPEPERRRTRRVIVERPVKLCRFGSEARYFAGRTYDLSAEGALIELDQPASLGPGQMVRLAIALHRQQGLVRREQMREATVVRSLVHGGRPRVAVRFADAIALQRREAI